MTSVNAQEASDAIRYSQTDLNGTARFRAMSGAFGALGGDFSALSVNPAGGAVFTTSQLGVTFSNHSIKNESDYFGNTTSKKENSFDLNQLGAIWVYLNDDIESNWKKVTLAFNYENSNDFDNKFFSQGYNPNNSIANYFTSYANGFSPNQINFFDPSSYSKQQAYFGYVGNIITSDGVANSNNYISNVAAGGNYYQENSLAETGYNGKLAFNAAFQYTDRFFFGVNLNAHFSDYTRFNSFYEDYQDTPGNNPNTGVQALRFNSEQYTFGNGFSFQLGGIAKVTNELRLGLSYESPTWFNLVDQFTQSIVTDCPDCGGSNFLNPGTVEYQNYSIKTPSKYTGSLAYVFGKYGLISVDYAMKDYSKTKFTTDDSFFDSRNATLKSTLDVASEVRVGAEARIKKWSIRGGYRFEESPYKDQKTVGDLQGFSGGFGYNFGAAKADISYAYAKRDSQLQYFSQGFTDRANINSVNNSVSLTLLFEM